MNGFKCSRFLVLRIMILITLNFSDASSIYSHVGDDVQFSWTLNPLPDPLDILEVRNTNTIRIFFVSGTTVSTVESSYTGRIVFNGDTTTGQMKFTLRNVSRLDAGVYTASVSGAIGSTVYQGPTLYVLGKPTKPLVTQVSPPVVNEYLQLNCSMSSTTIPGNHNLSMTFIWSIDGVNITNSTGRYLINGFRITIKNIQKNDTNKIITCTGTERGGLTSDTSNTYKIEPLYGPENVTFTPSTTSYSRTEQGTIPNIACSADCKPNCSYIWTKDGQVTLHSSGSSLSLRNINRNDAGVYRCTAWNDHGTKNSSDINVDVKYGPGEVTFTPSTTSYSPTEQGTIPDITCTADCKPNCSYRWAKAGQVIPHGSGSILSLRNINRYDAGVYRCTAWNDHGTKKSNEIKIDVKYGPSEVTFTPSNTSYSLTEQATIPNITCTADCNPNCSYIWTKDGQVTSHGFGSILSLRNINRKDAGVYRCTACYENGNKNSSNINVDVKYGPGTVRFTPTSSSYAPKEQGTIPNINCSADCKPNCSYRWTKDGQVTLHSSGSSLSLRNINRNDAGVYRCTAWNDHGTKNSSDINVDVKYGPVGTIKLQPNNTHFTFIENTTVNAEIKCQADCKPDCLYKWNSTNENIPLTFGKINRSQAGAYICTVSNEVGSTEVSVTVIVQYPSRIIGHLFNKVQVKEAHKTDAMTCQIDAVPLPIAIWSKDNNTVFNVSNKPLTTSVLQIENANCVDTGNYKCTVDNHITNNSLDCITFRLTVDCAPRLKFQHTYPKQVFVTTNEGLNISELIIAYPLPNISWSFQNESIEDNSSIALTRTEDFEISIHFSKNVMLENDFGIYTLVAENEFGKATASYNVTARRKPDAVINIEATCVSSTEANISFSPGFNGGSEQTFYIVYNKVGIRQTKTVSLNDTKKNMTSLISGLIPQNEYVFKIISSNSFGNSLSNKEATCLTKVEEEKGLPYAVIGGVTGSIVGLIVIGGIVSTFFFMRRRKDKTKGNNDGLRLRPVESDEDQMKDNVLYEPAGPKYVRPKTPGAANRMDDYPNAERSGGENISNGKNTKVQKTQKEDKSMSVDPNAIYSIVNKPKKEFAGSVYENIETKTDDQKSKPPAAKKKVRKNKGRLQYADLVFAPSNSGKTFVIHGLENKTNYVDIDFSKKAEALPPEINEMIAQSTEHDEKK